MATAPRPGGVRRETDRDKAFVITVDGIPQRLVVGDLGPKDARLVRKLKLGFSLAGMLGLMEDEAQVDLDIPCVLWWLARVKAGEKVTYEQAEDEFPSYEEFSDRVVIDLEGVADEDEAGSPEA